MPHFLDIQTRDAIETLVLHPIKSNEASQKVAVDASGHPCRRAWMAEDQSIFFSGCAAQNHEDALGNTIPKATLLASDDQGNLLRPLPPTTGLVQNLEGPIAPEVLLAHLARKVYRVDASDDLRQQLLEGAIYQTSFRPVATTNNDPCFLMGNSNHVFLLQCVPIPLEWLGPQDGCVPEVADDEADEEEDWL